MLGGIKYDEKSPPAHKDVGWNNASRLCLNNALRSIFNNPNNRSGLPPHRYI